MVGAEEGFPCQVPRRPTRALAFLIATQPLVALLIADYGRDDEMEMESKIDS